MLEKIEYVVSKVVKKLHFRAVKNSTIHKSSKIGAGSQVMNSTMERNSFCGYDCVIINTRIGSFCSISSNCQIGGASHTLNWVSTSSTFNENKDQISQKYSYHKFEPFRETIIGHDVWIGANCLIKSGVEIGTGSVIGMGSIVTKNIPPYEIWAGNPAKLIRKRFDDTISQQLLSSKWWEYPDDKLRKLSKYITNVNEFLANIYDDKRN